MEMEIRTTCPLCGRTSFVTVDSIDFNTYCTGALAQDSYRTGALIQDVFPYLSADEREMLISGICPECWDAQLSEPEDEEEPWEEDWDDTTWDEVGFDPYEGCYTWDC